MENKELSPEYQMDISEACITADNVSTSSASPTISNQVENETSSAGKSSGIDLENMTGNLNSLQLTTSVASEDSMHNRRSLTLDTNLPNLQIQKLTPVHHHPLMMIDDENDLEDSCNNIQLSNFPDVVLAHNQPKAKSLATADLVNSVNNNNGIKSRKPIYREPSPVSSAIWCFLLLGRDWKVALEFSSSSTSIV